MFLYSGIPHVRTAAHQVDARGLTMEPQGTQPVMHGPENPKRSAFASGMPRNVKGKRVYLLCVLVVAAVLLVLGCVSALM